MHLSPQCKQVVDHIEKWGHINAIEAIRYYGITRLAARIHELKGTAKAMKAIKRDDVAKGFATYVPDWDARREVLKKLQQVELSRATSSSEIVDISIRYASKFTTLNLQEKRYAAA